eukprot:m.163303 g.163303  ORF g.163303 m.163303 type:complete len:182 (+) comp13414_c1_seq13:163-708(+)
MGLCGKCKTVGRRAAGKGGLCFAERQCCCKFEESADNVPIPKSYLVEGENCFVFSDELIDIDRRQQAYTYAHARGDEEGEGEDVRQSFTARLLDYTLREYKLADLKWKVGGDGKGKIIQVVTALFLDREVREAEGLDPSDDWNTVPFAVFCLFVLYIPLFFFVFLTSSYLSVSYSFRCINV